MIELKKNTLLFRFSEVHPKAQLELSFKRTLRIPDDDRDYPLPPGLGCFPLRHVDDYERDVPQHWLERGGVMLPMYQSEAMWINFTANFVDGRAPYPFLVKIATGKINAVSGEDWSDSPQRDPQDYVVVPRQPWLDGYCIEKGIIRQFVAMPLGAGYSAEEQLTGEATWGGLQICAYPMKRDVFERRFPRIERSAIKRSFFASSSAPLEPMCFDMGLSAGGRMKQDIYDDPYDFADWDLRHRSRCFVHLANSMVWRQITGQPAPTIAPTAAEYDKAGLPWFDYYSDDPAVQGSAKLQGLKSVAEVGKEKGDVPLPENASVPAENVVQLTGKTTKHQVREW